MTNAREIKPFDNCPALDGYHCVTSSLRKIFHHYGHSLSEYMLLGLGAGMGFIYWRMKMGSSDYVFVGGRGNNKNFFSDLGKRVGVGIEVKSTSSAKRAEASLFERLRKKEPVMLFGDMGFLPWFEFPQEYHFGAHTFVVCGYDGKKARALLASDIDQRASGLKKGFYFPVSSDSWERQGTQNTSHFHLRIRILNLILGSIMILSLKMFIHLLSRLLKHSLIRR